MARHLLRLLALAVCVAGCGADAAAPDVVRFQSPSPGPTIGSDPAAGDAYWSDATPAPPTATAGPQPYRGPAPGGYRVDAMHAPPFPMPFRLQVPAVSIDLPMLNVGMDRSNAMAAPEGPLGSAYWHEAFWYRGGVLPGAPGTATIAGHLDDTAGRPAAFWRIRDMNAGMEVDVVDQRSGTVMRFQVTETDSYSLGQASTPTVMARIFGAAAAQGLPAGPDADGLSHLTMITCTGRWTGVEYNHRFVAYAVRIG